MRNVEYKIGGFKKENAQALLEMTTQAIQILEAVPGVDRQAKNKTQTVFDLENLEQLKDDLSNLLPAVSPAESEVLPTVDGDIPTVASPSEEPEDKGKGPGHNKSKQQEK